jgi:hypothetical protein
MVRDAAVFAVAWRCDARGFGDGDLLPRIRSCTQAVISSWYQPTELAVI